MTGRLLLVLLTAWLGTLASASGSASAETATFPAPPKGVLVNQIDHTTPRRTIAKYMELARQAGAGWVRVDFYWYSVQWSREQPWDWHYFDDVVDEAGARGLRVIPILWGTPRWASDTANYGAPRDLSHWEAFVRATVRRYRARVKQWEIWNEPDLPSYWAGTTAQYAELLARSYTVIKALDPAAAVWLGGLAQGGPARPGFLVDILRDPAYPAGRYFDVHNIHTNFRSTADISRQIRSNAGSLTSVGLTKPLVVTEASYTSDPAYQKVSGYTDGEAGYARYLVDAYETMLAENVRVIVWASLKDAASPGQYQRSGLVRVDLVPKAAYVAFQRLASSGIEAPVR